MAADECDMWRDNGWGFGFASQRKREMRKLLKEVGRLTDSGVRKKAALRQEQSMERLSAPRVMARTCGEEFVPFFPGDTMEEVVAASANHSWATPSMATIPPGSCVLVLDDEEEMTKIRWGERVGYVEARKVVTQAPHPPRTTFLQPRQGETWRRQGKGVASQDVLLKPHAHPGKAGKAGDRFWLYDAYHLSKQAVDKIFSGATTDVAQTAAYAHLKKILNKIVKKSQRDCAERFGILLDIITTNSLIQTGIPHELGNAAYKHLETVHYDKAGLKFCFIGITDNVNCRAARDVFCRESVLADSGDVRMREEPKRTFDALDNQHMYCVFPLPESKELAAEETRVIGDTAVQRGDFVMPKRTIPPPVKMQTIRQMRELTSQARRAKSADPSRAAALRKEVASLREGKGTTLLSASLPPKRPESAVPGKAPFTPGAGPSERSSPERPQTACASEMSAMTFRGASIKDIASKMRSDSVEIFGKGGLLSTSGDDCDPVQLLQVLKAAQAVATAEVAPTAAGSAAAGGRHAATDAVGQVKSGRHLASLLRQNAERAKAVLVVLYGAPWSKDYRQFVGKFQALAQECAEAEFVTLDVERLIDEASKRGVERVPTVHVYHEGELVYQDEPMGDNELRACLEHVLQRNVTSRET
eukprot:TRINITY_DN32702_c0_g1_i1.p1 TRINITY_DN32702_c0_g1~~TRINITY_DN32702_c0_g1_i1.p1  ORF type:complete len:645 (+),score=227.07 TRINITY_DN32702_c0_g1_i1:91-2025(+)